MPVAEQDGAIKGLFGEIHIVDIHPDAGDLNFWRLVLRAEFRHHIQQPTHGQRGRGFQPQLYMRTAQLPTGIFQLRKTLLQLDCQHAPGIGKDNLWAITLKKLAGKVFFQRADMTADRARRHIE